MLYPFVSFICLIPKQIAGIEVTVSMEIIMHIEGALDNRYWIWLVGWCLEDLSLFRRKGRSYFPMDSAILRTDGVTLTGVYDSQRNTVVLSSYRQK